MTTIDRTSRPSDANAGAAQVAHANGTSLDHTPPRYTLAELLAVLGHVDDRGEKVSVCWRPFGGAFSWRRCFPGDAPGLVGELLDSDDHVDVWFGVNPIDASVGEGRGKATDVTRLTALYADLDVKPGACPDLKTAHDIIDDLAAALGDRPSAVTYSGHGLQPYWVVDRDSAEGLTGLQTGALLQRFGRFVKSVAAQRGCSVDSVFDLPRILRVPNTVNCKVPGHPAPVWCQADTGKPLTVDAIRGALDDVGVTEIASDTRPTGVVVRSPDEWVNGSIDCPYVTKMVAPWDQDSDRPTGGRHQWAMNRAVRLAAARRLGCVTEKGVMAALEHLEVALVGWCKTIGSPRDLQYDEVDSAYRWAVEKVATFTDEETRSELGDHRHGEVEEHDATDSFDLAVYDEMSRMRVREEARRRLADEKAGPAADFDAGLLCDMLDRPSKPPYRIDKVLPSDGGMLVVAQRKTGKTTLMLNLARSLITGQPFLGRFTTIPVAGRVAILNYEVSGDQLARWASEVGVPADQLLLVNLRGQRDPLSHNDARKGLADLLRQHKVESLIVDPFGRAYSGNSQNDPGEVGGWLMSLDTFTRSEAGARDLILTAHAGWNGERTRGSSALEDWADSVVTMTSSADNTKSRYLRAIGRDVSVDEDRLEFDTSTRLLTMTGDGGRKEANRSVKAEALRKRICDYVKTHPGAVFGEIDKGVSGNQGEKRSAIDLAEELGQLRRDVGGPGKSNKHYLVDPIVQAALEQGVDRVENV